MDVKNIVLASVLCLLLILFVKFLIDAIVVKISQNKIKKNINKNVYVEKKKSKNNFSRLTKFEKILWALLKINPSVPAIWISRLIFIAGMFIFCTKFYAITFYFVFEFIMFFLSKASCARVEEDLGISGIPKTNDYINVYIPSYNNGEMINTFTNRFVQQQKDPVLTNWWNNGIPKDDCESKIWQDVIKIYNQGKEAENNGQPDPIMASRNKVLRDMTYYNKLKNALGDIKSIKFSFYVFIPILSLISLYTNEAFWKGPAGIFVVLALCGLLLIFTKLLDNLHNTVCRNLF